MPAPTIPIDPMDEPLLGRERYLGPPPDPGRNVDSGLPLPAAMGIGQSAGATSTAATSIRTAARTLGKAAKGRAQWQFQTAGTTVLLWLSLPPITRPPSLTV